MAVHTLQLMLLAFAFVGFAGAGAALAVARHRWLDEGDRDLGLAGIAAMFLVFGTLCTIAAGALSGVVAFGGVVAWGSYLLTAQRLGLFSIETRPGPPPEREPSHPPSRHHPPEWESGGDWQ